MTETGSRLLLGVAAVLAGTTVLLGVFGLVYNPLLLLAALPFAAATYFLWGSATGRLDRRMREQATARRVESGAGSEARRPSGPAGQSGRWRERVRRPPPGAGPGTGAGASAAGRPPPGSAEDTTPTKSAAASVLGIDPEAEDAEIRRAFREKARELHPDAPDGDEAEFRRVRTAYERLTEGR